MTWSSVLFLGWMTMAWLPDAGLALYENPVPQYVDLYGSFYTELGAEATYGCFFAGGAVKTNMWNVNGEASFWPNQAEFTVDAGIKLGGVRVGWKHTCYHPIGTDMVAVQWLGGQIRPKWEGNYDAIYLHVEGGKR